MPPLAVPPLLLTALLGLGAILRPEYVLVLWTGADLGWDASGSWVARVHGGSLLALGLVWMGTLGRPGQHILEGRLSVLAFWGYGLAHFFDPNRTGSLVEAWGWFLVWGATAVLVLVSWWRAGQGDRENETAEGGEGREDGAAAPVRLLRVGRMAVLTVHSVVLGAFGLVCCVLPNGFMIVLGGPQTLPDPDVLMLVRSMGPVWTTLGLGLLLRVRSSDAARVLMIGVLALDLGMVLAYLGYPVPGGILTPHRTGFVMGAVLLALTLPPRKTPVARSPRVPETS